MNKTIEAIVNGKATTKEYFDLINTFDFANITLQKDKKSIFTMAVNKFDSYQDTFEFSQAGTETAYMVKSTDIESVNGELLNGTDTFHITARLKDGHMLSICIFHTDTNEKSSQMAGYNEIDAFSLKEYLESLEDKRFILAKVTDAFGLEFVAHTPQNVYIYTSDEDELLLHISNGSMEMELPVFDDSCNEIYIKEGNMSEILIRPYGQPFMEIKLFIAECIKN